jgi:GntR family transcriptional regulator, transcriptional repressor for pyruvate dehydrogenase complex
VEHFAQQIVGRVIKPGDLLDAEPDLATQFGVSKPTVRESLQNLASLGLVRVQQGKRTAVLEDADWDFLAPVVQDAFQQTGRGYELAEQLHEVRMILEVSSAELAAQRAEPVHVNRLRELIGAMAEVSRTSQDLEEFLRFDRAFHEMVARASRNRALLQVIRNLHQFLSTNWLITTITVAELPHLTRLHASVADAIERADPVGARRAMQTHLSEVAAKRAARRRSEQNR